MMILHEADLYCRIIGSSMMRYEIWEKFCSTLLVKKNSPVTGREWPRGFQEVKVPRFHDNGTGCW